MIQCWATRHHLPGRLAFGLVWGAFRGRTRYALCDHVCLGTLVPGQFVLLVAEPELRPLLRQVREGFLANVEHIALLTHFCTSLIAPGADGTGGRCCGYQL